MTKKINNNYTRSNKYYFGGLANTSGAFNIPSSGPIKTPLNFGQKLQVGANYLTSGPSFGGIANTGVTAINSLINPSGNSTKVGNALSTVGSLASNIPGIGGLIGAGVNMLGGIYNAAFGSNLNDEFISQTESNIKRQAGYTSSATDNASLLSDWSSFRNLAYVDKDDVGSEGWFSNAATDKTNELNKGIDTANLTAWYSLGNTARNVDVNNDLLALGNFTAYGGPIHIKKKNRGKFTDYCGGEVTSECIAKGKRSSNPTIRKRATFAANARRWKHGDGGPLNPYSAESLVNAIYDSSVREEFLGKPSHNYDFTISEEEANKLGYYPDKRGHRDDRVKKSAHPTHPSRGKWNSFEEFELTDKGIENPNYTLFGLNDGGQDPQAIMTYKGGIVLPEITITPKESYIMNSYDNIKIFDKGGYLINKNSSSRKFNNSYKEGEIYDVTEEEVKILKELGYEFEYV